MPFLLIKGKIMLQYVTRRRRDDIEQLEYPDCYDEFDGPIPTGRIVSCTYPLKYLVVDNIVEEKTPSIENLSTNEQIPVQQSKIVVTHHYGTTIMEKEYDFSISDYKAMLDSKFWPGFVETIEIK